VKSLERLTLAHLWVAFAAFTVACFFGVWQMWARSPLPAPFATPDHYFLSLTAHGVSMTFVLTTFFVMGFGYFTAETRLGAHCLANLGHGSASSSPSPAR
jgi:cytochrome c oxidase subunit I